MADSPATQPKERVNDDLLLALTCSSLGVAPSDTIRDNLELLTAFCMNREAHTLQDLLLDAADEGRLDVVKVLLAVGADPSKRHSGRFGLPHLCAAANGHFEVTMYLLEQQPSLVSKVDEFSQTALMLAASHNRRDILLHLLDKGATPSHRDDEGRNALDWAAASNHVESIEFLRSRGLSLDANANGVTALHYASRGGAVSAMEYLRTCGLNATTVDRLGQNILHYAASGWAMASLEYIVEHQLVPIDASTYAGLNALHVAVQSLTPPPVPFLHRLQSLGLSVHSATPNGHTALHLAASSIFGGLHLPDLLTRGARLEDRTIEEQTPLHLASQYTSGPVAQLLAAGAYPFPKDLLGRIPLHYAMSSGHVKDFSRIDLRLVPSQSANVFSPIDCLGMNGIHQDLNDGGETTALELKLDSVRKEPAALAAQDFFGWNGLLIASNRGDSSMVMHLTMRVTGLDPTATDYLGRGALHLAARTGDVDSVEELIEHPEVSREVDNLGRGVNWYAHIGGNLAVLELLRSRGIVVDHEQDWLPPISLTEFDIQG